MTLQEFIQEDNSKVEQLINQYPIKIPVPVISDFLHMSEDSTRSAIENGSLCGLCWHKVGKANKGYCVPTGTFVRWYLNMRGII